MHCRFVVQIKSERYVVLQCDRGGKYRDTRDAELDSL